MAAEPRQQRPSEPRCSSRPCRPSRPPEPPGARPRRTPRRSWRRTPAGRPACGCETRPWSTTTSSSTHSPPALRISVFSDGHEVSRPAAHEVGLDERPRAVADHADGLAGREELAARTRSPRCSVRSLSGLATPPGSTSAVVVVRRRRRRGASTGKVAPLSRWLNACTSPSSGAISTGVAARLLDRLPGLGQLDLLDALVGHRNAILLPSSSEAMTSSSRSTALVLVRYPRAEGINPPSRSSGRSAYGHAGSGSGQCPHTGCGPG